jgi:hypothetical protein
MLLYHFSFLCIWNIYLYFTTAYLRLCHLSYFLVKSEIDSLLYVFFNQKLMFQEALSVNEKRKIKFTNAMLKLLQK